MKDAVLILGAGNSLQQKIGIQLKGDPEPGPRFPDNFREVWTIDIDPRTNPKVLWDLESIPWPVPRGYFDEVHAYEVLEHLGDLGNYYFFFSLWEEIWDVLKPNGLVCATTPWWQSVWAWQDPGHRRVYSQHLLTYLDQDEYQKQIGTTAMTDYRRVYPPPYSFKTRMFQRTGDDPELAGFSFVLQKEEWNGRREDSGGVDKVSRPGADRPEGEVLGGGDAGPGEGR